MRKQPKHGGHEQRDTQKPRKKGEPPQILGSVLKQPGTERNPAGKPDTTPIPLLVPLPLLHSPTGEPPYLRQGKGQRKDNKYGNPDKNPPPPELLGDGPGGKGSNHRRHNPASGKGSHDGSPQPLGISPPDNHIQGNDHQPTPEPLHGPPGDEQPHDPGGPGQEQPGGKGGDARGQRPQRPLPVRPLPGKHHPEQTGREVPGEGERVQRHPVQLPSSDRHGGPHGSRLKGDQQHDGHDPDTERPIGTPEHPLTGYGSQGSIRVDAVGGDAGVARFQ